MGFFQSSGAFDSFEKAAKSLPRNGPNLIIVFNSQGLPILQFARDHGIEQEKVEFISAQGVQLVRTVIESLQSVREGEPERIAIFYKEELITIERQGPFILYLVWSNEALSLHEANEAYIKRLIQTLYEELT